MLNRIITLVAVSILVTSTAHALDITSAGSSIGGGTYKPSNGVTIKLFSDNTTYAAGSANSKGQKEYATNNSDPKIYFKTAGTAGTPSISAKTWTPDNTWTAQ